MCGWSGGGRPDAVWAAPRRGSRFDGRATIAVHAGSGGVDQGHKHFLATIVLAGASITELTSTLLRASQADLRCRLGAGRVQDGGRLVPGQELEVAGKGRRSVPDRD